MNKTGPYPAEGRLLLTLVLALANFMQVLDLTIDGIPRFHGFVALNSNQKRVFQVTASKQEA